MGQKTIVATEQGECVPVAGVLNFLHLVEAAGWRTVFLGPAIALFLFNLMPGVKGGDNRLQTFLSTFVDDSFYPKFNEGGSNGQIYLPFHYRYVTVSIHVFRLCPCRAGYADL